MEPQQARLDQDYHCFFKQDKPIRMKLDRSFGQYLETMNNPYLLDVSNKTGSIFMPDKQNLCGMNSSQLEAILRGYLLRNANNEYYFGGDDITMIRVSPCETMVAVVTSSNIVVIYLPDSLGEREMETKFEITGACYHSLEWSPPNQIYCRNQYFLTLDSKGNLRIHFISTDEMFSNLDEGFICATFSVDGGLIYAVSFQLELLIIDPLNAQILFKRSLNELEIPSELLPTKMMQVTPNIMVIGCLCTSSQEPQEPQESQEQIEELLPFLIIITGDLLDSQATANLKIFQMTFVRNFGVLPKFRFHFVQERQLLLFSHSTSNQVQALHFTENGDYIQLEPLDLNGALVRGFVFYKGAFFSRETKQKIPFEYKNQKFVLPWGPHIFVLDSFGLLHNFTYYDTRYDQSILMDPVRVETLRGDELKPTIHADRTLVTAAHHFSQKPSIEQIKKDAVVFEYQGSCKAIWDWEFTEPNDNPYMLDCIPEIGQILTVNGKRIFTFRAAWFEINLGCGMTNLKRLDWMLKSKLGESCFFERNLQEERGNVRMVRVSDCKYLVAMIYGSSVCIQKTEGFVGHSEFTESGFEAEFTLPEGRRYTYLEWPHLNLLNLENPYFLTLDDQETLRIHYVKEGKEEIIGKGEFFRCAGFSLNGNHIYAINEEQELYEIYFRDNEIVMKRKIQELSSNPKEIISIHIQQLSPYVLVIGSVMKAELETSEATNVKPHLHIFYGDTSNLEEELGIKKFEMSLSETYDPMKPLMFRFVYDEEKKLLFFGHSGSNIIRTLYFLSDGNTVEINAFNLQETTLRGIFFVKEMKWRQNRGIELIRPSHLLILDSEGYLHNFVTQTSKEISSKFAHILSMDDFLNREDLLKRRFNKKEKPRGKSQTRKIVHFQEKKRTKSQHRIDQSNSKTKISFEEKQRRIKILKGNYNESTTDILAFPKSCTPEGSPKNSEFRSLQTGGNTQEHRIRKVLLFMNKAESDVVFKVEGQEFPAQKTILSEKYKFFKNMWTSGMTESHSDVIEISDTKASIFKAFLAYAYLDIICLNEELAFGLFEFAERYLIDDVKEHCEKYLGDNLTLDNCIKIFEAACLYDAASLKEKALLFFSKNLKKVTERKDLEDLPKWSYLHIKRIQWTQERNFHSQNESESKEKNLRPQYEFKGRENNWYPQNELESNSSRNNDDYDEQEDEIDYTESYFDEQNNVFRLGWQYKN